MEINEALMLFQADKKGKYSAEDLDAIFDVINELGLVGFEIKRRSDVVTKSGKPYPEYIRDAEDIVHFHQRMIVSSERFKRRDLNQESKYKSWPHFLKLEGWVTSSKLADRPQCPDCFIDIPPTDICGRCEKKFSDIE